MKSKDRGVLQRKELSELNRDIQNKYKFLNQKVINLEKYLLLMLKSEQNDLLFESLRQVRVVSHEMKISLNIVSKITVINSSTETMLNQFDETLSDLIEVIAAVKIK